MTVIYHEEDGNLTALQGKRVNVLGYGNMGRPIAFNLRDSGVNVVVSEPRPEKISQAELEGFLVRPIEKAAAECEIIMPLLRDEDMPKVYLESVSPHLQRGQTLIFSSAYNIAFGFIEAPPFVDVGLVSAKTLGHAVRERFANGQGFASFVAVAQDASRNAWNIVLAAAKAMGALRGGAVEIRFEQEAELDLFVQQAILPLFHSAVMLAARLLIEDGYPPEAVFTELYLSGETSDYLRQVSQRGIMGALQLNSLVAQFGMLSRFDRFNDLKLERTMELTLNDIRNGNFAQEWAKESGSDYARLRKMLKQRQAMDIWELEQQTLELLNSDDFSDR
ncbi:MAG: NAD(P)-binding domain-containing protein [Anaerolineae bacterium]|nr:NAD(P)-binding domain-containing protein [Anaerolineae bacterium]